MVQHFCHNYAHFQRKTLSAAGKPLFSCVPPPRPCSAHTPVRRFFYNFLFPSLDFPCTQAKHSALFWLQWHSWCSFPLFPCFRPGAAPCSITDWICVSSPVFYSLWLTSLGISAPLRLRFFSPTLVLFARRRMRPPRCGGGGAGCGPRSSRAAPAAGGPHTRACVPASNSCQNKGLQLTAAYRAPY